MKNLIQKYPIFLALGIFLLLFLGGLFYLIWQAKTRVIPEVPEVKKEYPSFSPAALKAGKIGETEETFSGKEPVIITRRPESPPIILASALFNGSGKIKEIKADRILVAGDGSTFADQQPRDLILIFTENTWVRSKDRKSAWQGLEGLKYLKEGQFITFESPQNIRGKVEFEVSYINQF
jgi:hypothetical protein